MAMTEKFKLVDDPAEELTCTICTKVLCEPHLVNCCGQQFCKECLQKWLLENNNCPHCQSMDFSHMFMQTTSKKTRQLKVYCLNSQHGCKAVLKMSECEEHLATTNDRGCAYVRLECPNACTAQLFRGEIQEHTKTKCPKRKFVCPHCYFEGQHQNIGHHENECPEYPSHCPLGCEGTVLRKDLEAHQDTCPLEPVSCPLFDMGCKTNACRRDLERHIESNAVQHVTVLAQSHTELQEEHNALKKKHNALQRKHNVFQGKHNTLQEEHNVLQEEHAVLKEEHAMLKRQHSTLTVNYKTERSSQSAILTAIKNIRLSYCSDSQQLDQICTIITNSSSIKIGETVCLVLSESNQRCGQHYFTMPCHASLPTLKFRLEWEISKQQSVKLQCLAKFYSLGSNSMRVCAMVELCFGPWKSKGAKLSAICCSNLARDAISGGITSEQLIGNMNIVTQEQKSRQLTFSFRSVSLTTECQCDCHRQGQASISH